jgi:O-antigen/teichoic acid export membrane protein
MEDFKNKIFKGFVWESSTKIFVQLLSWCSTVIVARLLTPEDYGIVAISGVFIIVLTIFSEMGLSSGLINKKEITNEEVTGIFWLGIIISFILFCLILLLAPLVENFYEMAGLANIMMASGTIIIISSLRVVPSAKIMRELNFKFRSLVDMLGQISMIIVTITLAYFNYGPWSLVIGSVTSQIVITVFYISRINGIGAFSFHWEDNKELIFYGAKVMSARIIDQFSRSIPSLLIAFFLGQKQTGLFSLSQQVGKIPLDKIGVIFNRIIFPAASRIKEDISGSKALFFKLHKYLLMISCPFLVGLSIVTGDLIPILFTDKWAGVIPLLQLISLLNIILVSSMIMPPVLLGLGRADIVLRYSLINLIMIPIATVIGLQWGLVGMVISWFCVYPISYIYLLHHIKNILNFRIRDFFASFYMVILVTLLMAIVTLMTKYLVSDSSVLHRLPLTVVSGFFTYIILYYLFDRKEINEMKNFIKQARS